MKMVHQDFCHIAHCISKPRVIPDLEFNKYILLKDGTKEVGIRGERKEKSMGLSIGR